VQERNIPLPWRSRVLSPGPYQSIGSTGGALGALLIGALLLVGGASGSARAQESASALDNSFLSRMTIAAPLFTQHYPNDRYFNDANWGGVLFYALDGHFSLAGGDFINSYRRNTAFGGLSLIPWDIDFSRVQIDPGLMLALDLNGGYKGYDPVDPFVGALTVKVGGHYFDDPQYQCLNRFGVLITVIPGFGSGTSTAVNLGLTFHL
jgi:hypothetical protein